MSEERARQGIGHLQAAVLEVIAAARAFLDVAEEAVWTPDGARTRGRRAGGEDLVDRDDGDPGDGGEGGLAGDGPPGHDQPAEGSEQARGGRGPADASKPPADTRPRPAVTRIRVS